MLAVLGWVRPRRSQYFQTNNNHIACIPKEIMLNKASVISPGYKSDRSELNKI